MAVYKHRYSRYSGGLTAQWQRFLVLPRFAYRKVFQSRFFTIFFVICFLVPLGGAVLIYLRNNLSALNMLRIPVDSIFSIDTTFFSTLLAIQGVFAFLLTALVGPGLVSPDLTNNGLALYLSRPFSRTEYLLGKASVLLILQSCVTWVPLVILYLLQSSLAGGDWMITHARILVAVLLGAWVWMLVITLLALAISAWVRWRSVAAALLFGVFFVSSGFSEAVKAILWTRWGGLLNLNQLIRTVWAWLFTGNVSSSIAGEPNGQLGTIPVWSAWVMLVLVAGFCLLLLSRRIRAYEVVR
jgi:ABC-2 type transport system permease protein